MRLFLTFLFLCSFSFLIAQQQEPTEKLALVRLRLIDKEGNLQLNKALKIKRLSDQATLSLKTDEEGSLEVLLEVAESYSVLAEGSLMELTFDIEVGAFQRFGMDLPYDAGEEDPNENQMQLPEQDNSNLVNLELYILNDDEKPLQEKVYLEDPETKERWEGTTDANGLLKLIVPNASSYLISFEGAPNYTKIEVSDEKWQLLTQKVYFNRQAAGQLYPNEQEALFNFNFSDLDELSNVETFILQSKKSNKKYTITTNEKGFAQILVPLDDEYPLSTPFNPDFAKVVVPQTIFTQTVNYQSVSGASRAKEEAILLETIRLRDSIIAVNERVKNELLRASEKAMADYKREQDSLALVAAKEEAAQKLVLIEIKQKEENAARLAEEKALAEAKLNEERLIAAAKESAARAKAMSEKIKEEENAARIAKEQEIAMLQQQRADLLAAAAKEREDRAKELEERRRLAEEAALLARTEKAKKMVTNALVLNKYYKEGLAADPDIFEKEKKEVLFTLNRFKKEWKNKIIVTDVTSSMEQSYEQIHIWQALNLEGNKSGKYVFFNDGDLKTTKEKVLGETGGIYTCEAKSGESDKLLKTMEQTIVAGTGGDVAENDLEAILAAIAMRNNEEEIILIADKLSKIRDFSLISEIKVPIRVILCGGQLSVDGAINPQYLTLAYRTGGSIHTMTKDYPNLNEIADKATIMIDGFSYQLRNGEFLRR